MLVKTIDKLKKEKKEMELIIEGKSHATGRVAVS